MFGTTDLRFIIQINPYLPTLIASPHGLCVSFLTSDYTVSSLSRFFTRYLVLTDASFLFLRSMFASSTNSFVFQKLTHPHSPLRLSTLLALLLTPESDPLVAGPTFAKEALVAASADPSLDMDEVWESWEARVCEG